MNFNLSQTTPVSFNFKEPINNERNFGQQKNIIFYKPSFISTVELKEIFPNSKNKKSISELGNKKKLIPKFDDPFLRKRKMRKNNRLNFALPCFASIIDEKSSFHLMAKRIAESKNDLNIIMNENTVKIDNDSIPNSDKNMNKFIDIHAYKTIEKLNATTSLQEIIGEISLLNYKTKCSNVNCMLNMLMIPENISNLCNLTSIIFSFLKLLNDVTVVPFINYATKKPYMHLFNKELFLKFFEKEIPELTLNQKPPHPCISLPKFEIFKKTNLKSQVTTSYVESISTMQKDIFDASILNSTTSSLYVGSESDTIRDDEKIDMYEKYFADTCQYPDMNVLLQVFKFAYALLSSKCFPKYNRFPYYLVRSINLIFEKSSKKLLNYISGEYEYFAPITAENVFDAIECFTSLIPKWEKYLDYRNALFAAKPYYYYEKTGVKYVNAKLSELNKSELKIQINEDEKLTIKFLRIYVKKVTNNESCFNFFNIIDKLDDYIIVNEVFASALILIPFLTEKFKLIDEELNLRMKNQFVLESKDKLILNISEKKASGGCSDEYKEFLASDAPFSMKLFLDHAITLRTSARLDTVYLKLAFTNIPGFKMMQELDSFTSLLQFFLSSYDFTALYDLFLDHPKISEQEYIDEVNYILQGRKPIKISKNDNVYTINKINIEPPSITPSFTYLLENSFIDEKIVSDETFDSVEPPKN